MDEINVAFNESEKNDSLRLEPVEPDGPDTAGDVPADQHPVMSDKTDVSRLGSADTGAGREIRVQTAPGESNENRKPEAAGEASEAKTSLPSQETDTTDTNGEMNSTGTGDEDDAEVQLPPISLPAPTWDYVNGISVFCISQQGDSHIKMNVPCQDRSAFRWVKDKILLAAIADGVGSCQLSDYGAETAVKAALDYLEQYFTAEMSKAAFVFDTQARMKEALQAAMQYAYDAVEKRAEEMEVLLYSLQSTLTIAVYDGRTLYFAHAGDDGIVAQNKEGVYAMVTSRIKGEEASSVYPLQTKAWYYGKVVDTTAFVMATDGVLDAFVRPEVEKNRVYYRFIEPVFYTVQKDKNDAEAVCRDWDSYLKSSRFRAACTDDITFVGVVNQAAVQNSVRPVFNVDEWNRLTQEYERKRKEALYPQRKPEESRSQKKENNKAGSDGNKAGAAENKAGAAENKAGAAENRAGSAGSREAQQSAGPAQNKPREDRKPGSSTAARRTEPSEKKRPAPQTNASDRNDLHESGRKEAIKEMAGTAAKESVSFLLGVSAGVAVFGGKFIKKAGITIGDILTENGEKIKQNQKAEKEKNSGSSGKSDADQDDKR